MYNLFELIFIIILLGLIGITLSFLKKRFSNKIWTNRLTDPRTTWLFLMALTFFGFFTNLDYSMQWGCLLLPDPIFSVENIIYSSISLILISLGYFSYRQIGTKILIAELLFWLSKLFFVKEGYAVGPGAFPLTEVLFFDVIALALRLVFIKQITKMVFKTALILVPVFLTMAIKVEFFR